MYNIVHTFPHTTKNKQNMKKKKSLKKRALDREHKDITCAVRLPKTMYDRLHALAKQQNSSLSDIIRDALLVKMEQLEDEFVERKLKEARRRAELAELGLDPRKMLGS